MSLLDHTTPEEKNDFITNKDSSQYKIYSQEEIEKEIKNKESSYYASYGGSKDQIYGDSHLIYIRVQIQGEDYFNQTNIQLEIKQKAGSHHEFELICDPDEFEESTAYLFQNSKAHLGKRITFQFRQYGKTASLFTGILNSISTRKKDGIKQVILRGKSVSVLLDNGLHCRSFENKSFEEIINKILENYPKNLIQFQVNPNYKDKLNYIVQYNETDFQFIKRLATRFGEYFLFNGESFYLSAWGGKVIELMEGEDVYDYELKMEMQPQKFSYTAYDPKQSSEYTIDSESQQVQQSKNPFQQTATNASESVFSVDAMAHYDQSLLSDNRQDIERAVLNERKKRQNLVYMEARTNHPGLRVGDVGKMMAWMPDNEIFKSGKTPIESYKILEITHKFTDGEGYSNHFIGVPRDLTVPPDYDGTDGPKADIQHATVTDNKDPLQMGRVRVQFIWQKPENSQSPWIQLIQPHGGAGKGTYMNPEIGETVLVAFQGGNAEAPIVLGTAYNGGEIAEYYTRGNDIKVIQTRSGTRMVFNDAEGSILITDPSGNSWFMDGKGNSKLSAPKNLELSAGEDIIIHAGQNMTTTVGLNNSLSVGMTNQLNVAGNHQVQVTGHYTENITGDFTSHTEKERKEISKGKIEVNSEGLHNRHSQQKIQNNSEEKTNLF